MGMQRLNLHWANPLDQEINGSGSRSTDEISHLEQQHDRVAFARPCQHRHLLRHLGFVSVRSLIDPSALGNAAEFYGRPVDGSEVEALGLPRRCWLPRDK